MPKNNIRSGAVHGYTITANPRDINTPIYSPIAGLTGFQTVINHDEHHIHTGESFEITYYQETLSNDAAINIYIRTNADYSFHIISVVASHTGNLLYQWFDDRFGATMAGAAGGTDLKPRTGNNSQDYGDFTTHATDIRLNPTFTTSPTLALWEQLFAGGTGGATRSPVIASPSEKIITKYPPDDIDRGGGHALLRFTNKSGNDSPFSVSIIFVEEMPGGLRG